MKPMEETRPSRSEIKDLLLEDYRYRAEALKSSEESGETRFNLFIGLVTLVAGALARHRRVQPQRGCASLHHSWRTDSPVRSRLDDADADAHP
jgi:hypothetical protein